MNVHIVTTSDCTPALAFFSFADAVDSAIRAYSLDVEDAIDRVVTVPLLASASSAPSAPKTQMEFRRDGTVFVACHPDDIGKFFDASAKYPLASAAAPSCDETATD